MLTKAEQYHRLDAIIHAVCEVGGITYPELIDRKKTLKTNVLRGVAYVISRYSLIHPSITASMLCRTRQNVITVAKNYHKYLQAHDSLTTEYYNRITKKIEDDGIRITDT